MISEPEPCYNETEPFPQIIRKETEIMMKTTVIKKTVCYGNKRFQLTYRLLVKDGLHYGIQVDCCCKNTMESERIWTGRNRINTLRLLYLFAKETVFPVALRETFENL